MTRLKVLQIITLSEIGGAQKVLYHLVAGLSPACFDITVACAPGGELIRWLKELGWVRVVQIPQLCREISPWRDTTACFALYSLMRKGQFDVVHCHSSKAGIIGRVAAYLAGVKKIIFTVHGWGLTPEQNQFQRLIYTQAERLVGFLSTYVVCVAQADRERALKEKLAPPSKLRVIYNGVPLPAVSEENLPAKVPLFLRNGGFQSGSEEAFCQKVYSRAGILRAELGLGENDLIVGTVCRLCRQKNPLFFLEVARNLLSTSYLRERLYFVLVGDGPLKQKCQDYIGQYHLSERVFLLGGREDAVRLMADFDVFCLFSSWEGLPLTVMEAMHSARPVVATGVGGVPELVLEGRTGFLVPSGNAEKAVEAVEALLKDTGLREQMGEAGYQVVREKFSLEAMVEQYRSLYLA